MDTSPKSHPFSGYAETMHAVIESPRNVAMLLLGASAGLPIMLVYQVLSIWLREADVSRSTIGFFVWVGFAYSLKFLWAPLVDRVRIPGFSAWLGNRRGWTLFAILGTALAMFAMSLQNPAEDLQPLRSARCSLLFLPQLWISAWMRGGLIIRPMLNKPWSAPFISWVIASV